MGYLKTTAAGAPGWRSRLSVRLQLGHDLAVREFEPRMGLWADGSEPGAYFRFCVSLSLCPSPVHALSLSVPKIINVEKKIKKKMVKMENFMFGVFYNFCLPQFLKNKGKTQIP